MDAENCWYFKEWLDLVWRVGLVRYSSALMSIKLLKILYIIVSRNFFRLVSSVSNFRSPSMKITLLVFLERFVTYLAALRWTISILLMASFVCGLHTDEQYSIVGRTKVLYALFSYPGCWPSGFFLKIWEYCLPF